METIVKFTVEGIYFWLRKFGKKGSNTSMVLREKRDIQKL